MAVNQKTASASVPFLFYIKGGTYHPIWKSNKGDLFQYYKTNANGSLEGTPKYSLSNRREMILEIVSDLTTGTAEPDAGTVKYYCNNSLIEFNTTLTTTTVDGSSLSYYAAKSAAFAGRFGLSADRERLLIIGDIFDIADATSPVSFNLSCRFEIQGSPVSVDEPVTVGEYRGGTSGFVTIQAGNNNGFVLRKETDTIILQAALFYDGTLYEGSNAGNAIPSKFQTQWEKQTLSGWSVVSAFATNNRTLTLKDEDINTYSNYRLTIKEAGATSPIGMDTLRVEDATDPYTISTQVRYYNEDENTLGNIPENGFNNQMNADSCVVIIPTLLTRQGGSVSLSAGQTIMWSQGRLYSPAGVHLANGIPYASVPPANTSKGYSVKVGDLLSVYGAMPGEYQVYFEATIS